jgi:hypothetical protein
MYLKQEQATLDEKRKLAREAVEEITNPDKNEILNMKKATVDYEGYKSFGGKDPILRSEFCLEIARVKMCDLHYADINTVAWILRSKEFELLWYDPTGKITEDTEFVVICPLHCCTL